MTDRPSLPPRRAGERVLLGRFGAPHGVRGEIRLQSFTADPQSIANYSPLTDESGARRFGIQAVRPQGKDMLVVRIEGVGDRMAAEALTGVELYVAREFLPQPEEDEFYLSDLEGLRAETAEGVVLGRVVAVHNFGAGDILEIAPPEGESLLFPFTKSVAPIVDVAGGRIVVAPPAESTDQSPTDAI